MTSSDDINSDSDDVMCDAKVCDGWGGMDCTVDDGSGSVSRVGVVDDVLDSDGSDDEF